MVNDVLIRSDAGHKQLSEYSRTIERELIAGAEKVLSDFLGEYGWMDEHTATIRAIIAYLVSHEPKESPSELNKRFDRLESKITQLTDAFVLSSCPMGLQKSSDRQADDELKGQTQSLWWENMPKQGILCWVSDRISDSDKKLRIVTSVREITERKWFGPDEKHLEFGIEVLYWRYATPLSNEEIEEFKR